MALIQKAFSDIITFSRSSNATRIGPTGRVEYAPHNLLLQSQDFLTTWTNTRSSEVVNAVAAPDGTVTADKLVEDSSASNDHVINQTASVSSSTTYTTSVFLKAGERTWAFINMVDVGISSYRSWFNLSTGQTGTNDSGNSSTITYVGNGWYRCTVTRATTSSQTSVRIEVGLSTGDGVINYSGNGTSGLFIWGAQLSVGPYPLDYTPTTSAAVYGPRFDFDPVTLAARGLLIEESRTNLLTYSEQFDNAAWTKDQVTVTANSVAAPDGTVTADTWTESAVSDNHGVVQSITTTSSQKYTISVYAKYVSRQYLILSCWQSSAVYASTIFNISTGAVANSAASGTGYSVDSTSITSVGNGWYRCTMTFTVGSSAATTLYIAGASTTTISSYGLNSYAGTSSQFYLWGAQLEAGSFATSYIPTLASSVTRSADVASVNTLSPWFNATEGTLFAESVSYRNEPRPASLSNSGSSDTIGLGAVTANNGRLYIYTSSVEQANLSVAFSGSTLKEAAAYKTNDAQYCANGTLSSQDTSVTLPTLNKMDIGYFTIAGAYQNGWIRRIAYYPRRLLAAELQALTA